MLYMQIGRETKAKALFDAAFDADPFNVPPPQNQMRVLTHMAAYTPVDSDHFSVLVEPKQDALHGKYISRCLESIYPELTQRFAYATPGLTKIEIMTTHQWFSAGRSVCRSCRRSGTHAGTGIELASPKATNKPFNWARVLKHEVVHVITLQQTGFNIPHWYTEALAVESEGYPRPQEWNKMSMTRVPDRKIVESRHHQPRFHPSQGSRRASARLLPGAALRPIYARTLRPGFAREDARRLPPRPHHRPRGDRVLPGRKGGFRGEIPRIPRQSGEDDPHPRRRREAVEVLRIGTQAEGRSPTTPTSTRRWPTSIWPAATTRKPARSPDKALKLKPNHPLASYVKASLLVTIGDEDAALELLKPHLIPDRPNGSAWSTSSARCNSRPATSTKPNASSSWPARTTRTTRNGSRASHSVHLRKKDNAKFLADIALIADNDADDLDVRKALAEKHLAADQPAEAARWATECLYIHVYDPTATSCSPTRSASAKRSTRIRSTNTAPR